MKRTHMITIVLETHLTDEELETRINEMLAGLGARDVDSEVVQLLPEKRRGRPKGRKCPHCQGEGHLQPSHGLDYRTCGACNGHGRIV